MDLIAAGCWNPLQPLCHFAWHLASQCTDTSTFILLHSLQFFPFNFVRVILHWQGFNSQHEHHTSTVLVPLKQAHSPDFNTCSAWCMGTDYSYSTALEYSTSSVVSWIVVNTWKTWVLKETCKYSSPALRHTGYCIDFDFLKLVPQAAKLWLLFQVWVRSKYCKM